MRIAYCTLGGTISSTVVASSAGARPALDAAGQLASVQNAPPGIRIEAHSLELVPSVELSLGRISRVARFLSELVADGIDGIVLSTGTDALEDVAWALHLTWKEDIPVIVTGAMKPASSVSADGPGNVVDALTAAASERTLGLGVLVCFAGELHTASLCTKSHTGSVKAFSSGDFGPLGLVSEGRVHLAATPAMGRLGLTLPSDTPPVALLPFSMGDDARVLRHVPSMGYAGLVIQGFGAGHVSHSWSDAAKSLAANLPVVLSTRVPSGPVFTNSYGFPGSERDLLAGGLICGGFLGAHKCRLLLAALLGTGHTSSEIRQQFASMVL